MPVTIDDLIDHSTATLNDLGRMKLTDLSADLQDYPAATEFFKKQRVQFDNGKAIQFNVNKDDNDEANFVGLYAEDDYNIGDSLTTGSLPWRHVNTGYIYDLREVAMNGGMSKIIDIIKVKRLSAMTALVKKVDNAFWGKPATSADELTPFGIDYWCVANSSEGFNGGNPSGFTSGAAGIDSSSVTRWANWTNEYTNVTKDDLITKMRTASYKTNFKPPVPTGIESNATGSRYGYYTSYSVLQQLETLAEQQNDNLGNDLASKDGKVMFRGNAVTAVPRLDDNSNDAVYGIDWGAFKTVFLRGWFMKEVPPRKHYKYHNACVVDVDSTFNWACFNRRKLFRIDAA